MVSKHQMIFELFTAFSIVVRGKKSIKYFSSFLSDSLINFPSCSTLKSIYIYVAGIAPYLLHNEIQGPPLVRSPLVRIPLVRILYL